ncbi:MAG: response regulator [Deinococcales bacterium]|nr:response regulator [Chitinophagaceae bacterium]
MNKVVILVAEDDADDRFLLQTAFNDVGGNEQLVFTENGVELIDYLNSLGEKPFYGFILLDLNMPRKDGREVLKYLKQHVKFKRIPIIVFSTTKNDVEVLRCYDLGANTYIRKPANYDELIKVIEDIRKYWIKHALLAA